MSGGARPSPALLASIAATAIDPSRWPEALEGCVAHVGARSATLISVRTDRERPQQLALLSDHMLDLPADVMPTYVEEHFRHEDEAWRTLMSRRLRHPVLDTTIWPVPDLEDRPDYRYQALRVGTRRRVAVGLHHDATGSEAIAWQFPPRLPEVLPAQLGAMTALAPHLAAATSLGRRLADLRAEHGAMLAVVDRLDTGVCIVDGNRVPAFRNARFEALLRAGDCLRLDARGRLAAAGETGTRALGAALRDVVAGPPGGSPAARRDLTLACRSGGTAFATIEAIDGDGELGPGGRRACVTLVEPGTGWRGRDARLAALYGLSPSETDVCARLLAGESNAAIARARCTGEETVRSQVTAVLRKTGTTGRATLAARALAVAAPAVRREGVY